MNTMLYADPMLMLIPALIGAACWIIDISYTVERAIKRYMEVMKED